MSELHLYEANDLDLYVVATSPEDATALVWERGEVAIAWRQVPDDEPVTLDYDHEDAKAVGGDGQVTKTAHEWAVESGRCVLAGYDAQ